MDHKVLTCRISKGMHKQLRIRLAQEETSFQDLMTNLLESYLEGKTGTSQSVKKKKPEQKEPEKKEIPQPEGDYLKTPEAAAILGVSERTLQRWIKSGKLKASKPAKDYIVPIEEVERLKKENK